MDSKTRNKKRSITGEERNGVSGQEVRKVRGNDSEAPSDLPGAYLAENTPPVKRARGRNKKPR